MSAIVLSTQSGDWEVLYIDGVCITQGHQIESGEYPAHFWGQIANKHNIDLTQVQYHELNDEDDEEVMNSGDAPAKLSDLKGNYEN